MKKLNNKQMIAMILAAALLLSNIPVTGFAQEQTYCGLEHEHESACYVDPTGGATEPVETKKTLLEKLLAAQSLQEMNDLLTGNETASFALNASQLSLVRQRADTIFAEAVVTEAEKTAYGQVSDILITLVKRLTNEAEKNTQKTPEPTGSATEPTGEATNPIVPEKTLQEKLLAAQSLQALHDLLMGDKAGAYTLTAEQLAAVKTHTDALYQGISEPTADDEAYYEQIQDTVAHLENLLQGGKTEGNVSDTLEESTLVAQLLAAQSMKELYDTLVASGQDGFELSTSEFASVKAYAEDMYDALVSPTDEDKTYRGRLTVAIEHFVSGGKIPLNAIVLTAAVAAKPLGSNYYFLTADLKLTSTSYAGYVYVPAGVTATIDLNGYALIGNKSKSVIYNNDGELTIEDSRPNSDPHYFRMKENAAWELLEKKEENAVEVRGGIITGGHYDATGSGGGGGIRMGVQDFDTKTIMNGGTIIGNHSNRAGAGSYGGVFMMNGGSIKGNYAKLMGGGVSVSGEFTMTGGYIGQNSISPDSKHASGKKDESDTGFYDNPEITLGMNSSFTMTNGTIVGNVSTVSDTGSPRPTTNISGGTITGNFRILNKNTTIISGTAVFNGRVYMANGNCTVREDGVIQNGKGANGGAVYLQNGSFYMEGGAIRNAEAETHGGAVYVANGTFSMTDGIIENNTAAADGGAVYLQKGALTMDGGTFKGNTAAGNGGAAYISGGNFTMTGGMIDDNTTTAENGEGGAVYVTGGNIFLGTEDCTDAECLTVSNNHAVNGGAFAVAGATPVMYCGTLTGNTATEKGGAIYVSGNGGFTMNGGIINGGEAETNAKLGGGVYLAGGEFTLEGATAVIQNNHATNGAGVYLAGGKPNLYQGALKDNTAVSDGGGIYIDQQEVNLEPKELVSITGNRADRGAGIFIGGDADTPAGFTVDKTKPGRVEIMDNTASGTNGIGGGVCISNGYFQLDADNITLQRNQAVSGGAVAVLSGNFTMSNGSIGGEGGGNAAQNGGAVYVSGGNVELSGGDILSNTADQNGGGIAVLNGKVIMSGGSVSGNKATSGEGGGIYVSSSGSNAVSVMVYSGTLSNNSAAKNGGAVAVQGVSGTITVQTGINKNHNYSGGKPTYPISHTEDGKNYSHEGCPVITGNSSGRSGGAFYISGNSDTHLNIYCLTDTGNHTNGDTNPLNEHMSEFLMVEGGRVYLSTAQSYAGIEGTPNVSPDGDNVFGHMSIEGSIHVVSGVLELFGSKDNPRLNGGLTLDIRSTSDKYIDHRKSENKLTVSYHENFFYPDGTPASRQTAFDIEAGKTHEIYGGLYAHEGYKLYGWNTNDKANPSVDTEGWYEATELYTFHMPATGHPENSRDGLNHYGNLTLYAIWKSNGYYVNFVSGVPEGQEWTGKDKTEPYTYDSTYYLPANWFVWPGHVFTGWLLPDGTVKQPDDPVMNLTSEQGATVTVTAQWEDCIHPIADCVFTTEEDTITKTCGLCKHSATAKLTAQNTTYDGKRHEATLECSDEAFWKPEIRYEGYTIAPQNADSEWQPAKIAENRLCIGAGDYTATITGGDQTLTVSYTIAKAKQDAPQTRPSYVQPESGTSTLTVNQIPENERVSGQSGEYVQYVVRYFKDGVQIDSPVTIPEGDPSVLTFDLPELLKVYSVLAGYPETDDYLASDLVSAELSFLFTGDLRLIVRAEEGIDIWLGQTEQDDAEEWMLFAKLRSDEFYLTGDDFEFVKVVTAPTGSTYSPDNLTITKSGTVEDGYLLGVTTSPTELTEITITVGGVKTKATVTGHAKEKQLFSDFEEDKNPVISRDSAFTMRFEITNYDASDYNPLQLTFAPALPSGTTIILRDRRDGSYWYTSLNTASSAVPLASFAKMGSGGSEDDLVSTDMSLQFIVDFSRASQIGGAELVCSLSAAKKDPDSNAQALSASLKIGLAGSWLSLGEEVTGTGLTQEIKISAGAGGAASKYDHRDMALVLTPVTSLPADAYIRMTMGESVADCRPDKDGKFIIPLGNFRALDTSIVLDLRSNMFPMEDIDYDMTAKLYLAQTDAEIAPLSEEGLRSTVSLRFESREQRTGIKIAVGNDQRLFTTADSIAAEVEIRPIIFDLFYNVVVELHQEFDGDTFGDTTIKPKKSGNVYTFDLTGRPTGDYCIVASLQTKGGYTINEARYYFIVQPSNDGS